MANSIKMRTLVEVQIKKLSLTTKTSTLNLTFRKIFGFNPIIVCWLVRKNRSSSSTTNYTKSIMLCGCLQNNYATKMPYQSKTCLIHGYKYRDDYYDDDAFNISHWDNDDDLIFFYPNNWGLKWIKHFFWSHHITHHLLGPIITVQCQTRNTI